MSTTNTDAGLEVALNTISESGQAGSKPVTFTLGDGEMRTIDLTSTYTPKSDGSSCSKPITKHCCTGKAKSQGQMESSLSSIMSDTNNLTKALMDKMTKDLSQPCGQACSVQDWLDDGFCLCLNNFEIGAPFPQCKPCEKETKCKPQETLVSIKAADPCEDKCESKSDKSCKPTCSSTPTPTPTPTPVEKLPSLPAIDPVATKAPVTKPDAPPNSKSAPTPIEKQADKADAIKKLEGAKTPA